MSEYHKDAEMRARTYQEDLKAGRVKPRRRAYSRHYTLSDGETIHIQWNPEYLDRICEEAEETGASPAGFLQETAETLNVKLKSLMDEEKAGK